MVFSTGACQGYHGKSSCHAYCNTIPMSVARADHLMEFMIRGLELESQGDTS